MIINGRVTLVTSAGRSATVAIIVMAIMPGRLTQVVCATSPQADDNDHKRRAPHRHRTTRDPARSVLTTPPAIVAEHEHLHHRWDAAVASGGTAGIRAREVAAILPSHFDLEQASDWRADIALFL